MKLSGDFRRILYGTYPGGPSDDAGRTGFMGRDGVLCIAGSSFGSGWPILNAAQGQFVGGSRDGIVARFYPAVWLLLNDEIHALAPVTPARAAIFTQTGPHTLDPDGADGSPWEGEGPRLIIPGSEDDDDAYIPSKKTLILSRPSDIIGFEDFRLSYCLLPKGVQSYIHYRRVEC